MLNAIRFLKILFGFINKRLVPYTLKKNFRILATDFQSVYELSMDTRR